MMRRKQMISVLLGLVMILTVLSTGCSRVSTEKIDYAGCAQNAIKALENLKTSTNEIKFSEGASADVKSLDKLKEAIADFDRRQAKVAFVIVDLGTGKAFSYNSGWQHTSQSSIKAPFIASILDNDVKVFEEDKALIKPLIQVSDGNCYDALYEKYGNDALHKWAVKAGLSKDLFQKQYPRSVTVIDMAKLWALMYEYLNSDRVPEEFVSFFKHTKYSALDLELGKKYNVQSKAGWENGIDSDNEDDDDEPNVVPYVNYVDGDPANDETATNDTGIVYSDSGDYICVVFSNLMSNPPLLQPLVAAIDEVHSSMMK